MYIGINNNFTHFLFPFPVNSIGFPLELGLNETGEENMINDNWKVG